MGYVFDFKDAQSYERWYREPHNRKVAELETRLMLGLLQPAPGETLLDIGCGTGASLQAFLDMELALTGIDPSPYMLDAAAAHLKNRIDLHRGNAEALPFDDNAFSYAVLNITLEFVDRPQDALAEACRVAKDRVYLGILNRFALKGFERRVKGIFYPSIYNRARFFSIWELKHMLRALMGDAPVIWRTMCQLPRSGDNFVHRIAQSTLVQRCPFGAYAGMVVSLVPRYRTTPLKLKYQPDHSPGVV